MSLPNLYACKEVMQRDKDFVRQCLDLSKRVGVVPDDWQVWDEPIDFAECEPLLTRALALAGQQADPVELAQQMAQIQDTGLQMTRELAVIYALKRYEQYPFEIMDATVVQIHAALVLGKVSSKELVERYLERISAYDGQGPHIRAMLSINPKAVNQAVALDEERKMNRLRGIFHGIPVILKDNYSTKDMPTTCGTPALEAFYPQHDAHVVQELRQAGAIILGKTNLHELALFGTTYSSLGGQTRNPYDLSKTPGGSSGGTGAGVSANFAALGTGTDAVNSIRSPASANNLVGIRPTKGLINLEGIIPVSCTQDNAGPIARTVSDAAILLGVMIGDEAKYSACLSGSVSGRRIGVLRNFFGGAEIHAEVNHIAASALTVMGGLGVEIVDIVGSDLDSDALLKDFDVQRYELKHELERYFSSYGAPIETFTDLLDLTDFDDATASLLHSAQAIHNPLRQADYRRRLKKIQNLKVKVGNIMDSYHVDALFYPHQKRLVVDIGEPNQADRNGILSALTGYPAITFQGGFSTPTATAPIGVPIGLELLGKPHEEDTLIALAASFERATHHRRLPPSTPALV